MTIQAYPSVDLLYRERTEERERGDLDALDTSGHTLDG